MFPDQHHSWKPLGSAYPSPFWPSLVPCLCGVTLAKLARSCTSLHVAACHEIMCRLHLAWAEHMAIRGYVLQAIARQTLPVIPQTYSTRGVPFGIVNNYDLGLTSSIATGLYAALVRCLTGIISYVNPNFEYTSCQMKHHTAQDVADVHIDPCSGGLIALTAFGNEGPADFWRYDPATPDQEAVFLPVPVHGLRGFDAGQQLRGRVESIMDRWVIYDGSLPHVLMPVENPCYVVRYFVRKRPNSVPGWEELRRDLLDIGFAMPMQERPPVTDSDGWRLWEGEVNIPPDVQEKVSQQIDEKMRHLRHPMRHSQDTEEICAALCRVLRCISESRMAAFGR
eukprot:gnl/TRDRNA2_/TRDRNA2_204769_c0_seq1.p1 gnl/TRDRNA2_/TRDRNA2_204769_c0~~gnl/TRDRNA2_/TRDRNA2_204769_c0_seq1.p1  ORF type:complete len:338 (+),score=11.63 gnl/TRDRNA2_/TRDRNA2_204769_c0_seq1:89-1102(+)